jgi:hypothetical protein
MTATPAASQHVRNAAIMSACNKDLQRHSTMSPSTPRFPQLLPRPHRTVVLHHTVHPWCGHAHCLDWNPMLNPINTSNPHLPNFDNFPLSTILSFLAHRIIQWCCVLGIHMCACALLNPTGPKTPCCPPLPPPHTLLALDSPTSSYSGAASLVSTTSVSRHSRHSCRPSCRLTHSSDTGFSLVQAQHCGVQSTLRSSRRKQQSTVSSYRPGTGLDHWRGSTPAKLLCLYTSQSVLLTDACK